MGQRMGQRKGQRKGQRIGQRKGQRMGQRKELIHPTRPRMLWRFSMTARFNHLIEQCRHGYVWDCRRGMVMRAGLAYTRHEAIRECLNVRREWQLLQEELRMVREAEDARQYFEHERKEHLFEYRQEAAEQLARVSA